MKNSDGSKFVSGIQKPKVKKSEPLPEIRKPNLDYRFDKSAIIHNWGDTPKNEPDEKSIIDCKENIKQEFKLISYCLNHNGVKFDKKFTFESLPYQEDDLNFNFWCNEHINNKSIIYPSYIIYGNNKKKLGTFRWWEVNHCEKISDGFIVYCSPSKINPDFS